MSIQTELTRIKGAKADLQSWVEENGVTVPDGTLIDGLVELAKTVETGGGGDDTQIDALIDRSITEISNSRVTKIGEYAFYYCKILTTANFPAATSIGGNSFYSCNSLTTVDFPVATSIGSNAFRGCSSLTTVDFPVATSIGSYAFQNCVKLTTANFPAATSIGNSAFYYCKILTTANFPAATSIGGNSFYSCNSLTTVDFPVATSIGSNAFRGCSSLTTVDFPVATSIGSYAFRDCSSLTTLILRNPDVVCTLSNTNAFTSTPIASGTGYIYVPSALVDSYKAETNWSTFADQIRAIEDYPDITGGAA